MGSPGWPISPPREVFHGISSPWPSLLLSYFWTRSGKLNQLCTLWPAVIFTSFQRLGLYVSTWEQACSGFESSSFFFFFNNWSLFGTYFFSTQHGLGPLFLILGTQRQSWWRSCHPLALGCLSKVQSEVKQKAVFLCTCMDTTRAAGILTSADLTLLCSLWGHKRSTSRDAAVSFLLHVPTSSLVN